MGEVVELKRAKKNTSIVIDGKTYISAIDFAERIGTSLPGVYQLIYEGKITFACKYRGKLRFEEKAVEPYKRSLLQKVSICRSHLSR